MPCISQIQKDGRRKRSFTERVFTTVLVGLRETNKDGEAKATEPEIAERPRLTSPGEGLPGPSEGGSRRRGHLTRDVVLGEDNSYS